jgi:phosphoserine phosphatase
MPHVATLIAHPDHADLDAAAVTAVSETLAAAGCAPGAPRWLADGIACDIALAAGELEAARVAAAEAAAQTGFDVVAQPAEGRRKRLLVADMDATIVVGETLDELADHVGLKDRIAPITERAMRGELDFAEALRERVGMLASLPEEALATTLERTTLMSGAQTLVATMRAHGAWTVLVSGGFEFFVARIAARLGFDAHQANRLETANGRLTGRVIEPILDKEAKLAALRHFACTRGLARQDTMAVGDGANDLPMIQGAGLGIAYHAKPLVRAQAPAVVTRSDLTALLYIQGYSRAEFAT